MRNSQAFAEMIALQVRGQKWFVFSKPVLIMELLQINSFMSHSQLVAGKEARNKP
jgi:hypothetical protein